MNRKSKVKPNLFIPGAAKSGTSSLHKYLNLHPDIYMSEKKEPHYFSYDEKYINEAEQYYKLFEEGNNFRYRGESSTGYMVFPNTIERIREDIGNPKFIFVLRNPIERIFSHYNWVEGLVGEKLSFEKAIKNDFHIEPNPKNSFGWGYKNYFQFGLYAKWLEKYYKAFKKKDILIILTEDLKSNPLNVMNLCCNFLEIDRFNEIPKIISNKSINYKNATLYHKVFNFFNAPRLYGAFEKYLPYFLYEIFKNVKHSAYLFLKNSQTTKKTKRLTKNQRIWLRNLYLEDVNNLKKLTKMDFSLWKDFENL